MTAVSDRLGRIVRLLETLNDGLPQVRGSAARGSSGFVAGEVLLTCPDCLANGRRRMVDCETCHGTGLVPELRDHDPYADNPGVSPYGFDPAKRDGSNARDREIERLGGNISRAEKLLVSVRDEIADADEHPDRWETERRRMWRDYDYPSLVRVLDELRCGYRRPDGRRHGSYPDALHALMGVHVYGTVVEPSLSVEHHRRRGLAFVSLRMPAEIRAPGFTDHGQAKQAERRNRLEAA